MSVTMTSISSKFFEDTNRFIKAVSQCNNTATSKSLTKIKDLAEPLLKSNPPQDDHALFLGQYYVLKTIQQFKPKQLNKDAKKTLNQVIKHLKPIADKHFAAFIQNSTTATQVASPKGVSNQGGNDCFLIALYQFLRSPSLTEHLVNHLPTELKNVLLDPNVNSTTLRQVIAGTTPFGSWCKELDPKANSQLDSSEALIALFDSIGSPEAEKVNNVDSPEVAKVPQSPMPPVVDQTSKAPPKYLNRLTNSLRTVWNFIASFFNTLKQGSYTIISAICYFMNPPDEINGADDLPDNNNEPKKPLPPIQATVITPLYFPLKSIVQFTPDANTPEELKNHEEFGGIHHQTSKIENQNILQFPLPKPDVAHPDSLNQLLETFFAEEPIDDKKTLSVNGQIYTAQQTRRLTLETAPQHLILAFKRSGFDPITHSTYKNRNPIQGVDLEITIPVTAFEKPQAKKSRKYFLKTFICHLGSGTNSGHFVCYRRDGNSWYLLNDSVATQVSTEEVQKAAQTAHVVFYEKN